MTARNRSRTFLVGAAAAALLAPLAVVAGLASPAPAAVGPRPHEVSMYKVEAHVDLSGEYPDNYLHTDLACHNGDFALDGMWRVDHVDQAQPDMQGDERSVVFYASYPDADRSTWHFRMENYADGNAQLKLFLTCIRRQTEENANHRHDVVLTAPSWDVGHHGLGAGGSSWYHQSPCPAGSRPVAPGFDFPADQPNRLVGTYPSPDLQGWQWAFVVDQPNTDVNVSISCLSGRVAPAGGHTHQLPATWRPNTANPYAGYDDYTWNNGIQEKRLSCDDGSNGASYQDHKAMVGAFWLYDWTHQWYLGMDPRPKTRAFKFWDQGGGGHVWTNVFCVKSRTGKQLKP